MSRFHDLMPRRVRDILLVSSDYDAFVLEEDGRLSDRLFVEYSELNLSTMPNLVHANTPAEALRTLKQRRFDLVLTTMRQEDPGVRGLSKRVKSQCPTLPVVLLAIDHVEFKRLADRPLPPTIDHVFVWTGDTRILLAIIKLIEDSMNVDHDTSHTGVQVIIVVEDNPHYYSTFLALLYAELMTQSQSLIVEGVNALHKLLRMRARPKILLATSFEQAVGYYRRYREHVLAVISDVQFPREGERDDEAGYRLAETIMKDRPDLPFLLQSANADSAARAYALKCGHLDKTSTGLLTGLQSFLKEDLGFGDFVFRLPNYTEVARAKDVYQMIEAVASVDSRSLHYHASREHFNVWLRARSMFDLADHLAKVKVDAFRDDEELRTYLLDALRAAAELVGQGVVADFTPGDHGPARWFVRLGHGSIGGKGRGIAFLHHQVARHNLARHFSGLSIRVPRTLILATDLFDHFLSHNGLTEAAQWPSAVVQERFLQAPLPLALSTQLRSALKHFKGPLAVRSSSLLEDSMQQSCAGVYETLMVSYNEEDEELRFRRLCQAIKTVYASTFSARARIYMQSSSFTVEDEKMAVVIQEVVGQAYGNRFYPHISGVAMSWNHYPVEPQKPEDGVAQLALGLGQTIVGGGRSVCFSPGCPQVLPHMTDPVGFLPYAQTKFYAYDMESRQQILCDLSQAEKDGALTLLASVYSADDDQFRDNLRLAGPRVLTFSNVLRWEAVPLADALRRLLEILHDGMGGPVELEFAADLASPPCLYPLQVRPVAEADVDLTIEHEPHEADQVFCRSSRSVGHGMWREVADIIYVENLDLDWQHTPQVAEEIAPLNDSLITEGRPYLLMGPGRWGSSDPSLGIPIHISSILGAAVIVEQPFSGRHVDPSAGSHFFHELVSRRIGYLCFPRLFPEPTAKNYLDWAWITAQPIHHSTPLLRHVRLERPLTILLDGRHGQGLILKPGTPG